MDGKRVGVATASAACATMICATRCFVGGRGGEANGAVARLRGPAVSTGPQPGSRQSSWLPASVAAVSAFAALRMQRKSAVGRSHITRHADGLADCPYALYGQKDIDIAKERQELQVPSGPKEIRMPEELKGDIEAQRNFFSSNLPQIYKDLKTNGAVVFRGFEISKDKATFGQVGQALELDPCEDPLHSVAARDAVDKKAGVYEAVNKPSRSKFYIGMHNESRGCSTSCCNYAFLGQCSTMGLLLSV